MGLFSLLKEALLSSDKIKKAAQDFERDVLQKSFKVKNVPTTSKYYEAYYIGFVQGAASKDRDSDQLIQVLVEKIIEDKKREEKIHAQAAMNSVAIPEFTCECGYSMNRSVIAVQDESHIPGDGDVSLCGKCGRVWIFTAERTMRKPTAEEEEKISADPDVIKAREIVRKINSENVKN